MDSQEILERRLSNHQLSSHDLKTPNDLIRWFGAVQSQDYAGAVWGLSNRLDGVSVKDISDSFNNGDILRTHVLRPTWHFVTPTDLIWLLELSGAKVKRKIQPYIRATGLDENTISESQKILREILRKNNYLTRSEIGDKLKKHGAMYPENSLPYILTLAELDALICSGPKIGASFTYALLTERTHQAIRLTREESLQELAKRYFQSHGPALLTDFVWWSGLTIAYAKTAISFNPKLKPEVISGKTYYFFEAEYKKPQKNVLLLPNYDEFIVAYRDRELINAAVDPTKLDPRQNVLFNNVVVIDGKVEGVWQRKIKAKTVTVETRLFRSLTKQENISLSKTIREYARFLNLELKS
jgi:hypothetical protein